MKLKYFLPFLCFFSTVFSDVKIYEAEILRLEEVVFDVFGEIEIVQGDKNYYVLEGDEKLFPEIRVEASRGVLSIEYLSHLFPANIGKELKCKLTVMDLNSLTLKGKVQGKIEKLKTRRFNCFLQGDVDLTMNLQAEGLIMKTQGDVSVVAMGSVDHQKIELYGKGTYDGKNLDSKHGDLRILGNYQVNIQATEELSVFAAGNSTIYYLGNPKLVEKKLAGNAKMMPFNP